MLGIYSKFQCRICPYRMLTLRVRCREGRCRRRRGFHPEADLESTLRPARISIPVSLPRPRTRAPAIHSRFERVCLLSSSIACDPPSFFIKEIQPLDQLLEPPPKLRFILPLQKVQDMVFRDLFTMAAVRKLPTKNHPHKRAYRSFDSFHRPCSSSHGFRSMLLESQDFRQ